MYNIALHLFAIASLPKLLFGRIFKGKYKKSLGAKLGFGFPDIKKGKEPLIWIHAVSFGETRAVAPLVRQLMEKEPGARFLFSSITETGHEEAKRLFPGEKNAHVYLPFDFPYLIGPIVRKVKPSLVILTETDFWLNFLKKSKKAGARIALVNGKMSERSFRRFKIFSRFSKKLFCNFDLMCVQNSTYAERFATLGVAQDKIHATGNLKLDAIPKQPTAEEKAALKKRLGVPKEAFVFTMGSTHHPEEEMILNDLLHLWEKHPHLKVLLVPRHPERFDAVADLLEQKNITYSRYTDPEPKETRVTLVDAMGVLNSCYSISDLAFVGGTLTSKIGGHNLIEPCFYGVPVLFGPYTFSQPDFHDLLLSYNAGLPYTPPNLAELIASQPLRKTLSENGMKLCQESSGSCRKTLNYLIGCNK